MSIQEQLQEIKENGLRELENFADAKELDSIRVRYLGKKGELTAILKQMGKLSPEERPVVGQLANEVRQALEAAVAASQEKLKEKELAARLEKESLDVTLPGRRVPLGGLHPLSIVQNDLIEKSGSWFSYKGERLGQGRDKVKEYLHNNPAVCEEIARQVMENKDQLKKAPGKAAPKKLGAVDITAEVEEDRE